MNESRCNHESDFNGQPVVCELPKGHEGIHKLVIWWVNYDDPELRAYLDAST